MSRYTPLTIRRSPKGQLSAFLGDKPVPGVTDIKIKQRFGERPSVHLTITGQAVTFENEAPGLTPPPGRED